MKFKVGDYIDGVASGFDFSTKISKVGIKWLYLETVKGLAPKRFLIGDTIFFINHHIFIHRKGIVRKLPDWW